MTNNNSPYDSRRSGSLGGRPILSSKPRKRKSISFIGEGIDVMEALAAELNISHADVLHLGLLRMMKAHGVAGAPYLDALEQKAAVLESDDLTRALEAAK